MALSKEDIDLTELSMIKNGLLCNRCEKFPRPGEKTYYCQGSTHIVVRLVCSNCFKKNQNCDGDGCYKRSSRSYPLLSETPQIFGNFFSAFTQRDCVYVKRGCNEVVHVDKLQEHEDFCIFQPVLCPLVRCNETVVFHEVTDHLTRAHPDCKPFENEWDFHGTKNDLLKTNTYETCVKTNWYIVCHGFHLFPQFHDDGKFLYIRVIILGLEKSSSFMFTIQFQHENGKKMTMEDYVFPIGREKLTNGDQCIAIPLNR